MDKDCEIITKDVEIKDSSLITAPYLPGDCNVRLECLKLAYIMGKARGFGKDLYKDADEVFELADMNLSYLMRK